MSAAHHHLDDETLNAVLDGEATDDHRVDASGCPECAARLARLGHVATALGAPVSPSDADRRRAAIAAAVAAHDAGVTAPPPLHLRRRRRVSPGWAAAAAVVLAGALAVPLVDGLGGNDEGREAATAGDRDITAAGGSVDEEGALADQQATPEASGGGNQLGEIDLADLDELAATIDRDRPSRDTPAAARSEAVRPYEQAADPVCEEVARQRDPSLQALAFAAQGSVTGRPAVVLAFEVTAPGTPSTIRLLVLAQDNCTELGTASAE
ncbi:MAG TPA: hypothetical protein VGV93_05725 [Acidimicrobiales bacterium]|nr:hypothetical protein [Acidimicrobiales bacterium]